MGRAAALQAAGHGFECHRFHTTSPRALHKTGALAATCFFVRMITRQDKRSVLEALDERLLMELVINPVDALCDTGLWTLSNLPSIGVGQRLAGVGPGLERVPGHRRGRGHADPDKRGLAAIVRHGDGMIRHPFNTLVGGPSGCGKSSCRRDSSRGCSRRHIRPPKPSGSISRKTPKRSVENGEPRWRVASVKSTRGNRSTAPSCEPIKTESVPDPVPLASWSDAVGDDDDDDNEGEFYPFSCLLPSPPARSLRPGR